MSRLAGAVGVAGVILCLIVVSAGLGLWFRHDESAIRLTVANETETARLVRITDGTSGRRLATVRLEARSRTVLVDHRLDVWWRDLTPAEQAAGRVRGVDLEFLAGDACLATFRTMTGTGNDTVSLSSDGGLWSIVDDENPGPSIADRAASPAVDPCAGEPAPARGLVANRTRVPIVVAGLVRVGPCSTVLLQPGDVARLAPPASADATAVAARSLEVQGDRWPLEPRAIVVDRYDVTDVTGSDIDPEALSSCSGLPLADHDEIYGDENGDPLPPEDGGS